MQDAIFKTYVKGIWCVQCPELIISGLLQQRGVIDADVAYFPVSRDGAIRSGDRVGSAAARSTRGAGLSAV